MEIIAFKRMIIFLWQLQGQTPNKPTDNLQEAKPVHNFFLCSCETRTSAHALLGIVRELVCLGVLSEPTYRPCAFPAALEESCTVWLVKHITGECHDVGPSTASIMQHHRPFVLWRVRLPSSVGSKKCRIDKSNATSAMPQLHQRVCRSTKILNIFNAKTQQKFYFTIAGFANLWLIGMPHTGILQQVLC